MGNGIFLTYRFLIAMLEFICNVHLVHLNIYTIYLFTVEFIYYESI